MAELIEKAVLVVWLLMNYYNT